ncbi:putative protein kinase [Neospora caninum Liverpool]|uniref:Protein kinase domain-containing protein n=1 Tax=Neospora caninum (strain Liverpool) TaxID=572307 RepID=F0V930_NEOCL|nr:putative protein kinase [Neospora caninum Liverpool]CBZ50255.1 putative protein kinase [Neospora caninum Liverpool]|eukprot:XP_003880289.1 putative protein kinase [Neospora caninum Liverpool]
MRIRAALARASRRVRGRHRSLKRRNDEKNVHNHGGIQHEQHECTRWSLEDRDSRRRCHRSSGRDEQREQQRPRLCSTGSNESGGGGRRSRRRERRCSRSVRAADSSKTYASGGLDGRSCSDRLTEKKTSVVRQIQDIRHHYALGRKLGSGYTASVYEAKCLATQQGVAIKDVDKSRQRLIACDSYYRAVYEKLAKLPPHRHLLLPPIALLETETHFYIVMERCQGSDMVEYVLKHPPAGIGSTACKRLLHQLLLAVHALHSHNVLHRDIKLDNIMFRYPHTESQSKSRSGSSSFNNELALIDFDMCLLLDRPGPPKPLTNANEISVVGTREYMAPECYKGHYSTASDMWSIGVILYVLIDGHFPFDVNNCKQQTGSAAKQGAGNGPEKSGNSSRDIRRRLRQGVRFEQRIKERHPLAVDLVQRLLTYDPTQRLSSAYDALCHPWLTGVAPPMPRAAAPAPALPNALPSWQFVPSSDQVLPCYSLPQQLGRAEASQPAWGAASGPVPAAAALGLPERSSQEGLFPPRMARNEDRSANGGDRACSSRAANATGLAQSVPQVAAKVTLPSPGEEYAPVKSAGVSREAGRSSGQYRATTAQQKHLAAAAMLLRSQPHISASLAASLGLRDAADHSAPSFVAAGTANEMLAEYTGLLPGAGRQDGSSSEWLVSALASTQRVPHGENLPFLSLPVAANDARCREPSDAAAASALSFFTSKPAEMSRQTERDVSAGVAHLQMAAAEGTQIFGAKQDLRLLLPGLEDVSSVFLEAAAASKGLEASREPSGPADFLAPAEGLTSAAYFASHSGRSAPVVPRMLPRGQTPSGDSTSASATSIASASPQFFSSSQAALGLLQGGEAAPELASSRGAWRTAVAHPSCSADPGVCTPEGVDLRQAGLSALKSFMTTAQWQGHASVGRLMKVNAPPREPQAAKQTIMRGIPSLNYMQPPAVACHLPPQAVEKVGGARLMSAAQQPPEAVGGI